MMFFNVQCYEQFTGTDTLVCRLWGNQKLKSQKYQNSIPMFCIRLFDDAFVGFADDPTRAMLWETVECGRFLWPHSFEFHLVGYHFGVASFLSKVENHNKNTHFNFICLIFLSIFENHVFVAS